MTREEAITILETLWNNPLFNDSHKEALNIAIKALEHPEQNVIAVVPCGDTISRQAVLEKAINVPIAKVVTEDKVIYRKIVFVDDIENLPSVSPHQRTGRWILIHRNGVNMYICSECNNEPLLIGESYPIFKLSDYCPYCGAKMEVKE